MTDNQPITAEELAELRRLHEAATPGPWTSRKAYMDTDGAFDYGIVGHVDGELRVIAETFGRVAVSKFPPAKESAEFIAAARNALPRLLDEIELLRRQLFDTQRHREKLDCRFVGSYGDADARHCLDGETKEPCQRCGLEMEVERLRAVIRRTHTTHCTDWPTHSPWCLLYEVEP